MTLDDIIQAAHEAGYAIPKDIDKTHKPGRKILLTHPRNYRADGILSGTDSAQIHEARKIRELINRKEDFSVWKFEGDSKVKHVARQVYQRLKESENPPDGVDKTHLNPEFDEFFPELTGHDKEVKQSDVLRRIEQIAEELQGEAFYSSISGERLCEEVFPKF